MWAIIGIGVLIATALLCIIWAACAVVGRADDQMDEWLANRPDDQMDEWLANRPDEPRCDMTGQRLTARERFERECG